MKKLGLTLICVILLVIVVFIAYKRGLLSPIGKLDASQAGLAESNSTETTTVNASHYGSGYDTGVVDDSQLKKMNQKVEIKNATGAYVSNFAFDIKNITISKVLKSNYTVNKDIVKRFSRDVMSEDGSLLQGLYYMYVDVDMMNCGERADYCNASDLEYVMIDSDSRTATVYSADYSYKDIAQFNFKMYYFSETDGKSMLSKNSPSYFQVGDTCEYEVCYIITEEMIENNNLYLRDSYGWNAQISFQDMNQQYIKLELNRGEIE